MKNNRTSLSFGLMISTVVAIIMLVVFIKVLRENQDYTSYILMIGVCVTIIIFNVLAFVTTDKPKYEFDKFKVKIKSILALSFLIVLFLYLMVMMILRKDIRLMALTFIAFGAMVLELLGITQKVRVRDKDEKEE